MYTISTVVAYFLYQFVSGAFTLIETFESKNALLRYIACSQDYIPFLMSDARDVMKYLNITGKDTVKLDGKDFIRSFLIMDQDQRIIDPRIWSDEIAQLKSRPCKWDDPRKYEHIYRETPVPYTGKHNRHPMRQVKHYHRALKQNAIPEYTQYVRTKARIEDPWLTEPFKHTERNWKKHRKHQWKE